MTLFTAPFRMQQQAWEGATDLIEKSKIAPDRADTIANIDVGETPSEVVYSENKLELLHYDAEAAGIEVDETHDVPILIVYALINRPYILDLQPNRSVVRRLLENGFDVYLIDWHEPSQLDAGLTLEDYVDRYIDNCTDVVLDRSDRDDLNLLGYCMGGTMAAMYATLHPDKVKNLGLMAASLCFDATGGVLEQWGSEEYYSPATVAETFGTIPAEFFDIGFALMDPVQNTVTKYANLFDHLEDEDFVENFARMEHWLSDGIDMAGATYQQFLEDIYQDNQLYQNEMYLGDQHVDITNLDMPVLQIVAHYDHLVPPEASKPFTEVIPSEDTTIIEGQTGHIGLSVSSRSHDELWPEVCAWFADRSASGPGLEDITGIGPAYADRLRDAGVESVEELAAADPAALGDTIDVSTNRVADWINQAEARLAE